MLKAYKTVNARRVLRVAIVSEYLDDKILEKYCKALDYVTIAPKMYISIFGESHYPIVNIDEYFNYIALMDIDISEDSEAREESFLVLTEILETKYGIEYVDSEN